MTGTEPTLKDFQRLIKAEVLKTLGISDEMYNSLVSRGIMPVGKKVGKYRYYMGGDIKRGWRMYFKSI